jgi:ABC-type phosphate transport system substrate-binding protein
MNRQSASNLRLRFAILCAGAFLAAAGIAGCGGNTTTTTTAAQASATTTASASTDTTATAAATQDTATTAGSTSTNPAPASTKLTYGANALEYGAPVTADQAQKLLDYLATTFSWNKTSPTGMSFGIAVNNGVYELAMVTQKGKETDPTILASAKQLAQDSSKTVFGGKEVDVYLTDASWNPLAVVKP